MCKSRKFISFPDSKASTSTSIPSTREPQKTALMNEIETFYGLVENTLDALRIFQMCRDGRLSRVRRRLHERERRLIRSGSVFVFDEEESGIRRWTDGRLWSPSRILGNFLIYRELEKKGHRTTSSMQPTGNLKSSKRSHSTLTGEEAIQSVTKIPRILPKAAESLDMLWGLPRTESSAAAEMEEYNDCWMFHQPDDDPNAISSGVNPQEIMNSPSQRNKPVECSIESTTLNSDPTSGESLRVLKSKKLTNNHKGRYIFKSDGFIKKTISIQLEGHTHHLVAYYSLEDFCRGHLQLNEALQGIEDESLSIQQQQQQQQQQSPLSPQNSPAVPFDAQLMEILRQVLIPIDLMLQQNFRKPAALLASATSNAQNLIAGNAENGEKLITALEYGAINPSDLQVQSSNNNNQLRKGSLGSYGGGIIFSSSPTTTIDTKSPNFSQNSLTQRPRRHSSFHPLISSSISPNPVESLTLLDESSQLSGEALEFLSHFSDEAAGQDDFEYPANNASSYFPESSENNPFNLANQSAAAEDLETELFGSILSSTPSPIEPRELSEDPIEIDVSTAIRGHDVLLSDAPN